MFYIGGGILFCCWIYWLWTRRKFYALIWKISGPLGYPLIGMAPYFMQREDILHIFDVYIKKYGTFLYSWLGSYPFVVVSDPTIAQDILTSPYCINKGVPYDILDHTIGRGLFSLKESEWNIHRKYLNTAFKHAALMNFIPVFNNEVDKLLKTMNIFVNQGPINVLPIIQKYTLILATKTTMGTAIFDNDNDGQIGSNLLRAYCCMLDSITEICFAPWLKYEFIRRICGKNQNYQNAKSTIKQFIKNLIKLKLLTKNESEKVEVEGNFINIALDLWKQGHFSQENVEDECNVIVFGAFETTANTIANVLILLSMFPQYQEKLYEELVSMFPVHDDFYITSNNIQDMTYLDMIINETMRVLSPVPIVCRQTAQDVQLSNGIVLPQGVQIAIDIFHIHRLEHIWGPQSHKFDPDNFLPGNVQSRHAYAFLPFTKGLRNCIGWRYGLLSSKIGLAKLLRNYKFTTHFKYEQLEFVEDITLKFKQVPKLCIQKREK